MQLPNPILLANWGDLLVAILPLLYGVFWLFSQFAEAKKKSVPEAKPRARPRPPVAPPPPDEKARREGAPKQAEGNVRAEVEEFLRRVRNQGEGDKRPQPVTEQPRRQRIEVLVEESEQPRPKPQPQANRPGSRPLPSQKPEVPPEVSPAEALVIEAVPLEKHHLAEGRLTERARHLGEQLSQTDERMEAHLHQKFDHSLGKIGPREPLPAEQVAEALATTSAGDLVDLLATPQGMQQAVILSEILHRPTDRW